MAKIIPTDVVRTYKDIHTWVGIISGVALFVAFYAGAITMFEEPLQRWASRPAEIAAPPSLAQTPELVAKTIAARPEAAKEHQIILATGPEQPARMTWHVEGPGGHDDVVHYASSLGPDGALQVIRREPAAVAEFVDVLHQQVGLPFPHEVSMPIMGAVSLLYAIALVSGVIVLLPSLVKDLFILRTGKNLKRMWLDVHNVLGVFSLPFHVVMALTAVVFAFHDQFYDAQEAAFRGDVRAASAPAKPRPETGPLPPEQIVRLLAEQAPGITPTMLSYAERGGTLTLRVAGTDPRHGLRAPTTGLAGVDPYTGEIIARDYLPGHQDGWSATLTSFFALHFGNFGGDAVRWGYVLLGLSGAFLFYSGNLLWIESRRRRERKAGAVVQSRSVRMMGSLSVGVALGSIAGISLTVAATKWLPQGIDLAAWHSGIYYAVFLGAIGWAFARGAARASVELLALSAFTTLLIPISSLAGGWNHAGTTLLVDVVALCGAVIFAAMAWMTRRRARLGPADSVWSAVRV